MKPILECVPNFSEGRDPEVIAGIVREISDVQGVKVLHIDSGYDAHRTVVTFAGEPEAVVEAAYRGIATAAALIDMRRHKGAHPRMGAADVCPLVPVSGMTMAEAVRWSKALGERVGNTLQIPVYLYEQSQPLAYRKKLEDIRKGEYEGWKEKIMDPQWLPDFGPASFNERSGCTVIGARPFLIAFNINLQAADPGIAQKIARTIRGSGYRGVPGLLPTLKAIGWYMPAFGCAQVSTNITDAEATPLHIVYEKVKELAAGYGVYVSGSELVGMVPESAILSAGRYYRQGDGDDKMEAIHAAVHYLGLDSVKPFIPAENILEWKLDDGLE